MSERAVATCQPCFRYGKLSRVTIPPKQGLTSESGGQQYVGKPGFVLNWGSLGKSPGFFSLPYSFCKSEIIVPTLQGYWGETRCKLNALPNGR